MMKVTKETIFDIVLLKKVVSEVMSRMDSLDIDISEHDIEHMIRESIIEKIRAFDMNEFGKPEAGLDYVDDREFN